MLLFHSSCTTLYGLSCAGDEFGVAGKVLAVTSDKGTLSVVDMRDGSEVCVCVCVCVCACVCVCTYVCICDYA